MKTLEMVRVRILAALKLRREPFIDLTFTYWLDSVLDEEDRLVFLQKEILEGNDAVDKWLFSVLIESGKYQDAGNGYLRHSEGEKYDHENHQSDRHP